MGEAAEAQIVSHDAKPTPAAPEAPLTPKPEVNHQVSPEDQRLAEKYLIQQLSRAAKAEGSTREKSPFEQIPTFIPEAVHAGAVGVTEIKKPKGGLKWLIAGLGVIALAAKEAINAVNPFKVPA